jgi:hypothetical protein
MHFLTGKHLPRRTFLRGLGATVALPLLDAMIPAGRAWRDLGQSPKNTRLICIEEVMGAAGSTPMGLEQNFFAPLTVGRNFEVGPISQLESLLPDFRDYITVVSNTDVRMAESYIPAEIGADHERSAAVFLTHSHPKQTQGSDLYVGPSLDQIHARKFGQDTALPSLELSIEGQEGGGRCGYGYHCAYGHVISWASPNEPLPGIRNPRSAFERLFGTGDSAADRLERRRTQQSLLDWIGDEVRRLRGELGAADRIAFDQYLSQIREIERRINLVEVANSSGEPRELPEAPEGVPDNWREHMEIMFDLQVLAIQGDLARAFSLKTGLDSSNRVFPESGMAKSFHPTSHHGNRPETILEYQQLNTYRLGVVKHLLRRLRDTYEGGESLLDRTAIVWGSAMGDPNVHNHRRCPLVLLGKANGALEGNMHIKAPDGTPMANAFLSLLQGMGHDADHFGDSTGAIPLVMPQSVRTATSNSRN